MLHAHQEDITETFIADAGISCNGTVSASKPPTALPSTYHSGHAGRPPKGIHAKLHDSQAVDLAHTPSGGIDQHRTAVDALLGLCRSTIDAKDAHLEDLVDVV